MQNNDKIYSEKRRIDCEILFYFGAISLINELIILKSCLFVFEFL